MKKILDKYNVFLKYIAIAVLSFLIDMLFFNIFNITLKNIIVATILARIISSFINFLLNKDKVFKSNTDFRSAFIKYYLLVIFQMLVSAFCVNYIYGLININVNFIKIPVDIMIFVANYFIQKLFIFKGDK